LPKVLHGMQHVRTQPQDERVSESRLYQVPGHRTYGASVHFLRYVPNKSREEHMLHGMCHDRTVPEHERVSEPSLYQVPGITHASALSAIRAKQIMRRTNVRISNAHNARNTVMMRSDVLKSPRLCAMHAAPTRTKRQGQSIVRSTNAQRAKVN
jgi:hypothetical protein